MKIHDSLTDRTVLTEIGERLAHRRISLGLTQAQAASEAGLSKRTITRIENGESAQLSSFIRLLRALDMLDRVEALVPEERAGPIDLLRLKGRQRKRASKPRPDSRSESNWKWGDDA
jgi:transcriptional regulator with XRE-family HTH domain